MKQSEINTLEEIRAMCHGFSAAIASNVSSNSPVVLGYLQERLQKANEKLARIIEDNAEYKEGKWIIREN